MKMVDKEQTCFFHWIQSFDRHSKQLIAHEFHDQHKAFCYDYKKTMSLEEIDLQYVTIQLWWHSFGATSKGTIQGLKTWLGFLHFHVRQWEGFMLDVSFSILLY
jgi:hypothetical protein